MTNNKERPGSSETVISQPEILALNKYFGFKQLSYINENGFPCIIPIEIVKDQNNIFVDSEDDKLWSIRIATISGKDYDLPSIVGVDRAQAIEWIDKQSIDNPYYVFFVSDYFAPKISGRMHISCINRNS